MQTLLEGGAFFEGPRWHEGRWWVSDFYRRTVSTVDADGREEIVMEVEGQPSGLGWMPDGSLLVVSRKDFKILRRSPEGEVTVHADLSGLSAFHLNDMVVDARGRAYVGNFGFDLMGGADPAPAELIRVDADGVAEVAADGLMFPNGTVITPDGATLIVGETFGARYTAFAIGDDGTLTDRRAWAEIEGYAPDGCALDAEGHIWSADGVGSRAARIAPGGAIVQEVRPPGSLGVFACMLGGDDGRTLLLCAAPDFLEHRRQDKREAVLFTTTVDVPHAGLP
jgi:sugar lactone lactonase YvrE